MNETEGKLTKEYCNDQMEFYLFLAMKEKEVNHDKYLYYLSKANTFKDLLEELEEKEKSDK